MNNNFRLKIIIHKSLSFSQHLIKKIIKFIYMQHMNNNFRIKIIIKKNK